MLGTNCHFLIPETPKMIQNSENVERFHRFSFSNDMIKDWLDYSNKTSRNFPKPTVDRYTIEFLMYACEKLNIEKQVFFMSADIIGKYLDIIEKENRRDDPVITILVLILICNKHSGQRSDLTGSSILTFLIKEGFKIFDLSTILNTEKTIMMKLKCHIPLLSTVDDMNVLIEFFVKPVQFIDLIHKQCIDVMNIFYLHSTLITDLLDNIYWRNKKSKLIEKFYNSKLYVPAGILICSLKICSQIKLFDCENTCNKISKYIAIPLEDLNLLSSIITNLLH